jgi:elongation factor P
MGIRVTEAKKGMIIRYEGELYQVMKYDHVTPGNWRAIHHLNLRNLKTGRQKDVRMSTSDQIEPMYVEVKSCQYLYQDANGHVFMDNATFDQFHIPKEVIEDALRFIVEGETVDVVYCENEPLNVQLPTAVTVEIAEAEEAVKGDTVSNLQKVARLVTGYELKVPGHIKVGEKIRVNTETGEFLGRA